MRLKFGEVLLGQGKVMTALNDFDRELPIRV